MLNSVCDCGRDVLARLECVCKAWAQVMCRDQGTQLWRPLKGGVGVSIIELSRAPAAAAATTQPGDDAAEVRLHDNETEAYQYYIVGRKENYVSRRQDQRVGWLSH